MRTRLLADVCDEFAHAMIAQLVSWCGKCSVIQLKKRQTVLRWLEYFEISKESL